MKFTWFTKKHPIAFFSKTNSVAPGILEASWAFITVHDVFEVVAHRQKFNREHDVIR